MRRLISILIASLAFGALSGVAAYSLFSFSSIR